MIDKKFELENTPAIIYTQDRPFGIGKLYINGERVFGLIDVKIEAHTKDDKVRPFAMVERIETDTKLIIPEGFERAITDIVIDVKEP
jgi:hypothetical protein